MNKYNAYFHYISIITIVIMEKEKKDNKIKKEIIVSYFLPYQLLFPYARFFIVLNYFLFYYVYLNIKFASVKFLLLFSFFLCACVHEYELGVRVCMWVCFSVCWGTEGELERDTQRETEKV